MPLGAHVGSAGSAPGERPQRPEFRSFRLVPWLVAVVAVGVAASAAWWWLAHRNVAVSNGAMYTAPIVEWASDEWDARVTADGRWVSFISDRDGRPRLWRVPVAGGTPAPLPAPGGKVISHAWAPDGRRFAVITTDERHAALYAVPVDGSKPTLLTDLGLAGLHGRVDRWNAKGLYIEMIGTLYRWNSPHSLVPVINGDNGKDSVRRDFDVSPDSRRVAFSSKTGSEDAIWTSDADGANRKRLSEDSLPSRHPRWAGAQSLVFQGISDGIPRLFQLGDDDGAARALTSVRGTQVPTDATPDGSVVTFVSTAERLSLWTWHRAADLASAPLTDNVEGTWPTSARDGTLAFERDGQIMVVTPALRMSGPQALLEGTSPLLSADGRWVAYSKAIGDDARPAELWVRDLRGRENRQVTPRFQHTGLITQPRSWAGWNVTWAHQTSDIYYVSLNQAGVPQIERDRIEPSTVREDTLVTAPAGVRSIRDLRLSSDDRRLGYVQWFAGGRYEVHARDLTAGRDLVLLRGLRRGQVRLVGWRDARLVVLRSDAAGEAGERTEVVEVDQPNAFRVLGVGDGAFPSTALMGPDGRVVYLTRRDAGLNVYVFSLDERTFTRVTAIEQPRVSFSPALVDADGSLTVAQQQMARDVWMMRLRQP